MPKSTKICPKSIQKSFENRPKCVPNRSTRLSERVLGVSWGASGGAWGPSRLQDGFKTPKVKVLTLSWRPSWRPKSIKNRLWGYPKGDVFWHIFMDRFLTPFGASMKPSWANLSPTWGQLEANLTPTWANLRPTWPNSKPLKAHSWRFEKSWKTIGF